MWILVDDLRWECLSNIKSNFIQDVSVRVVARISTLMFSIEENRIKSLCEEWYGHAKVWAGLKKQKEATEALRGQRQHESITPVSVRMN